MSQQAPRVPFQKPWRSHAHLVALLQQRGLIVADAAAAAAFLAHLSYYRFSGYCLAFEVQRHQFAPGVRFDSVVAAYWFDAALRDLVNEALEVVEIDLRATIAHRFGERHGAFGHTQAAAFFQPPPRTQYAHRAKWSFDHAAWLTAVQDETIRSKELFVRHFRQTYAEYPDIPVWVATEVMSFGSLSRMLQGMVKNDQKMISNRFQLQPRILCTWMHHLVYIRNLCAHHGRLWDRVWTIKPERPAGKHWQSPYLPGNSRLFATLLILRHLMKHIPAIGQFASQWQARVVRHLATPPAVSRWRDLMGLSADWSDHPAWQ